MLNPSQLVWLKVRAGLLVSSEASVPKGEWLSEYDFPLGFSDLVLDAVGLAIFSLSYPLKELCI